MLENRSKEYYLNGIGERTAYSDKLWKELVGCDHYKQMHGVFLASSDLLNNPFMCFEYGLYLPAILTCRVVIENALYIATSNENMRVKRLPPVAIDMGMYDYVESYNSTKCSHLLMELSLEGLKKEAQEQGIIENNILELVNRLQEKGNIAAHYAQRQSKQHQRFIPKRALQVGISKAIEEAGKKVVFDPDETKRILEITVKIFVAIIEGTNKTKVIN